CLAFGGSAMSDPELIFLVMIGGMVLIGLVATVGGLLHYRRERLLTHHERMKALEEGRDLPDDGATARLQTTFGASRGDDGNDTRSLARKCFATPLWVAFWAFVFASQMGPAHTGIAVAIAASAGAIGVTALICGTILATRTPPATLQGGSTKT